jgi:hypothetical protein
MSDIVSQFQALVECLIRCPAKIASKTDRFEECLVPIFARNSLLLSFLPIREQETRVVVEHGFSGKCNKDYANQTVVRPLAAIRRAASHLVACVSHPKTEVGGTRFGLDRYSLRGQLQSLRKKMGCRTVTSPITQQRRRARSQSFKQRPRRWLPIRIVLAIVVTAARQATTPSRRESIAGRSGCRWRGRRY